MHGKMYKSCQRVERRMWDQAGVTYYAWIGHLCMDRAPILGGQADMLCNASHLVLQATSIAKDALNAIAFGCVHNFARVLLNARHGARFCRQLATCIAKQQYWAHCLVRKHVS